MFGGSLSSLSTLYEREREREREKVLRQTDRCGRRKIQFGVRASERFEYAPIEGACRAQSAVSEATVPRSILLWRESKSDRLEIQKQHCDVRSQDIENE